MELVRVCNGDDSVVLSGVEVPFLSHCSGGEARRDEVNRG